MYVCVRACVILGISNQRQWSAAEKVRKRRLEWLGHVARMPDHRFPKSLLFGWLLESRPRCGPRRRWRDVICKDLKDITIAESKWYEDARRFRAGWRATYQDGLANHSKSRAVGPTMSVCEVCFRTLRRESDRKRHKCVAERQKPISEQRGAAQCDVLL